MQRIQKRLLAHRLHNAAGAQHRQAALNPQMRVEGALGRSLAAFDGDDHREPAAVADGVRLPQKRLGYHLPRHTVDGCRADGLVEAGLCHTAHPRPAVNRNGARRVGQQCDRGNDRQTRRGVDVVAAVLDDGARGPVCRQAAELGCDLHDDALGRAQTNAFRRVAGQQQPRRARRPQRRTGAGGVAAAQQTLPAADVVLKLGLRLCAAPSKQHRVLVGAQSKQRTDIVLCKGVLRCQHSGHA